MVRQLRQLMSSFFRQAASSLSRETASTKFVREIDGLRFIAIGIVFVQHAQQHVSRLFGPSESWVHHIETWHFGVELFFLISGFVLGMPFAAAARGDGRAPSLRQYYWRRVTRIEPPYVVTLIAFYSILTFAEGVPSLAPRLFAGLGYVHGFFYDEHNPINPVAWSLEIEVQFYLLAPLLAWILFRGSRLRRRLIFLSLFAGRYLLGKALPGLGYTVWGQFLFFLCGLLLVDIFADEWGGTLPPADWRWDLIAIPGWLALPLFWEYPVLPRTGLPIILLILSYSSLRSAATRRFLRWTPIVITGGMCYTIYLLHWHLLRWITLVIGDRLIVPASIELSLVTYLAAYLIPVALACVAFFLLVEKPCMRRDWPVRLWGYIAGTQRGIAESRQ